LCLLIFVYKNVVIGTNFETLIFWDHIK